jgi:hypothetical protein
LTLFPPSAAHQNLESRQLWSQPHQPTDKLPSGARQAETLIDLQQIPGTPKQKENEKEIKFRRSGCHMHWHVGRQARAPRGNQKEKQIKRKQKKTKENITKLEKKKN